MLMLDSADVAALFSLDEYITAAEQAFSAFARGEALAPALAHVAAPEGEFHIKAGGLTLDGVSYFGLKANGGFFRNSERGLPAIQGIVYLADAHTGIPLAIMDSVYLTAHRTGAATAAAAKHLARANSSTATICGAGTQGRVQLRALCRVRPIARAYIWDVDRVRSENFARDMAATLGFPVTAVDHPGEGTLQSDVVITCTPSRIPFLTQECISAGLFVAAVGADSPDKQELESEILRHATVVTDITVQCARVGELHHALNANALTVEGVHAELGQVITGMRPGRRTPEEIIVYDATGAALQDVACAAGIYGKALSAGRGRQVVLTTPPQVT